MRLLRTMLFTPGNNMRMIYKAGTLGADAIILDLEDAVPLAEKETARIFIKDSIEQVAAGGAQVFVRPNAFTTGLAEEDLKWTVREGLDGIVLPKAEAKDDVLETEKLLSALEQERGLEAGSLVIVPILETARGVVNDYEIVMASQRVVAIAFGAVDFTRDMGIPLSREGTELFYARSHVAVAARAAEVQAIDTPWIDVADREGLIQDSERGRQLGFRGKLLIHPSQIEPVNEVFSPAEDEVEYARKVVEAFSEAEAKGVGAISLDGKMIDRPNFRQAQDLIALAEAIARKEREG
jgi:citrate lyase subunit beta/citryl-CoA lyase